MSQISVTVVTRVRNFSDGYRVSRVTWRHRHTAADTYAEFRYITSSVQLSHNYFEKIHVKEEGSFFFNKEMN